MNERLIDVSLAHSVSVLLPIWWDFDKLRLPLKMQSPGQCFF